MWDDTRKRNKRIEVIVIFISLILVVLGLFADIKVFNGNQLFRIKCSDSLLLTIVQIQASVSTLTIALVALLSGVVSKSYMGISLSSFFLENIPYILKMKFIIVLEFILLVLNVVVIINSLCWVGISLFIVSVLFIVFAVFELYDVFKGDKSTLKEIESFVTHIFQKENDYENIAQQYIRDWKKDAKNQSIEDYKRYFEIYMELIYRLLLDGKIEEVNSFSERIARIFLSDDSKASKITGIRFIENYYYQICEWIDKNVEIAYSYTGQIHLIDRVGHEWYVAVDSLDAEVIEEHVDFDRLSKNVIKASVLLGYDENVRSESQTINSLAASLGAIVSKQKQKGNQINYFKWESIIDNSYGYYYFNIPEKVVNLYYDKLALRDFNVCYGYIDNQQLDMVKEAIFLNGLGKLHQIKDSSYVLRIMLIHGYMYYLAYRENTDCIDVSLQQKIKDVISDVEVIKRVSDFYILLSEDRELLSEETERKIESYLMGYDPFPKYDDVRFVIIDGVIQEYFLFVILYMSRYSVQPNLFFDFLDVDIYKKFLSENTYNRIRKNFIEMISLFDSSNHSEHETKKIVDEMLTSFEIYMKKKCKKRFLELVEKEQKETEKEDFEGSFKDNTKEEIEQRFSGLFELLNVSAKNSKRYNKLVVYNKHKTIDELRDTFKNVYLKDVFAEFMQILMNELINEYGIKVVKRNELFNSNKAFRDYLDEKGFDLFVGSQYAFGCNAYKEKNDHTNYFKDKNCYFISSTAGGLATRKGCVSVILHKVVVEVSPPEDDLLSYEKDEETGLIPYQVINGVILDFEEEELKKYLRGVLRSVKVSFDVTIGVNDSNDAEVANIIIR